MGDNDMTTKAELFSLLDHFSERDISGWQLYELDDGHTYPSTLLQYAREYCKLSGATMTIVNHQKSIYHFVPGVRISGAIRD
jgi:hypothetical protein